VVHAHLENRATGAQCFENSMQNYNNCSLPNEVIKVFSVLFKKQDTYIDREEGRNGHHCVFLWCVKPKQRKLLWSSRPSDILLSSQLNLRLLERRRSNFRT
jgi:hypothetical protein